MLTGDISEFGDFSRITLDEMKARGGAGTIWTVAKKKISWQKFIMKV